MANQIIESTAQSPGHYRRPSTVEVKCPWVGIRLIFSVKSIQFWYNKDVKQRERWWYKTTIQLWFCLRKKPRINSVRVNCVHDLFELFEAAKYSKNLPSLLNVKARLHGRFLWRFFSFWRMRLSGWVTKVLIYIALHRWSNTFVSQSI